MPRQRSAELVARAIAYKVMWMTRVVGSAVVRSPNPEVENAFQSVAR